MIADALSFLVELVIGWVPERQPWRAIVAGLYVLAAFAAVIVLVWLVVTTL